MPGYYSYSPQDRTPWLLEIGRRLRAEFSMVLAAPLPSRLAALVRIGRTIRSSVWEADALEEERHLGTTAPKLMLCPQITRVVPYGPRPDAQGYRTLPGTSQGRPRFRRWQR
jgi:hypothetical protein